MTAPDFVSLPASPLRWSVRRPPPAPLRRLGWVIGLGFTLVGALLLRGLFDQPSWPLALAVGAAFGLMVPLLLGAGALVQVHADGWMVYGFGRRPNVVLPLSAVRGWHWVERGALRGVGLEIAPDAVRFAHRKGVSYATMNRYRTITGCDLVLEFLTPEDLATLEALQAELEQPADPACLPPAVD